MSLLQWAECSYVGSDEALSTRLARYRDGLLVVRTYAEGTVTVNIGSDCCGQPPDYLTLMFGGRPQCSYCGKRFQHGGLLWSNDELQRTRGWKMESDCIMTDQAIYYLMKTDAQLDPYDGLLLAQELCYELTTDGRKGGIALREWKGSVDLFKPSEKTHEDN